MGTRRPRKGKIAAQASLQAGGQAWTRPEGSASWTKVLPTPPVTYSLSPGFRNALGRKCIPGPQSCPRGLLPMHSPVSTRRLRSPSQVGKDGCSRRELLGSPKAIRSCLSGGWRWRPLAESGVGALAVGVPPPPPPPGSHVLVS